MIQISTTAPANWPGATTPLNAPVRPVPAVTPVLPVGAATSAQTDEDPARTRRRGTGDARTTTESGEVRREPADAATRQADVQALAEQRRAEQETREAQEQADREAIERLRQVLVDTWDASAAVVDQALSEKEAASASATASTSASTNASGSRAVSLYDEAAINGTAGQASQAGQIISRRV